MKPATLAGLLTGAAVLTVGSIAAARRKAAPGAEPPYFAYTVQEGDTYSALALKFFGNAADWPLLNLSTPGFPKEKALQAGSSIQVPCLWTTVEKGESLAAVAKRTLGDAGRWRRIYEANKKVLSDPNKIGVGQRLAVPRAVAIPAKPEEPPAIGCDLDLLDAV